MVFVKKKLILGLSIILVATGLFLLIRVIYSFREIEKGGLQITANVGGRVFLEGKEIGNLPVKKISQNDTIPTGNYEIRIEPEEGARSPNIKSIKVLLPPPDGPTNAINLPGDTSNEIS